MRKLGCLIVLAVLLGLLVAAAPRPGARATAPAPATAAAPLLLRNPSLSATQIAFAFGGDLWIASRSGGVATRLTSGIGVQSHPIFSPDGTQIAFTGEYDGNIDTFVMPVTGGEPQRLTYHPGADHALAWTPDGKAVLFSSNRASYSGGFDRLFTMPLTGGLPEQLPLPMGEDGSYSADGSQIAYVPIINWSARTAWKRYRGGRYARIWIAKLADSTIVKIPNVGSNDLNPMWVGDAVYFLSDRGTGPDGGGAAAPVALYRYDLKTKLVHKVLDGGDRDIKTAQAGPGGIVYEQLGSIHLYDFKSGKSTPVNITVSGDFPATRPHFERVTTQSAAGAFGISPTGQRAVFEAHGDIFTVPAKDGDIRDITRTPGVEERSPAWSPDGQHIAFFSDASGDYALHIVAQDGIGKDGSGDARVIDLGNPPSFFYNPIWSPDSQKVLYTDKRLNLWYVDLSQPTPAPIKVATQSYDLDNAMDPAWSADSTWITWSQLLSSHMHAVSVYRLSDKTTHQITDGLSDARTPVFDASGKYLYFTASTDLGQARKGIDMTGIDHPVTSSIYCAVLRADLPSPLAPQSDDEKPGAEIAPGGGGRGRGGRGGAAALPPAAVTIDFDNIGQRIVALPIPAATYNEMASRQAGVLFLHETAPVPQAAADVHPTLWKFDLATRERIKFLDNVAAWTLSADGSKILYRGGGAGGRGGGGRGASGGGGWAIVATAQTPRAGEGGLNTAGMEAWVDPAAEWRQMFHEVWRIERDFLYDPGAHGLNLPAAEQYYSQYLPGLVSRDDLNYLFNDMLGEITIGHMFIGGGSVPGPVAVSGGLLGADYNTANGRYQFAHIYQGENWNPTLRAPLTEPGVNVKTGEYLLSVNGRELHASDNVYSFFEETANKQVELRVGPNADGSGSRTVTVVPLATETALRNREWMDQNRQTVDRLSHGQLAYVYLPDTANGGYTNFNRYYYAQLDKKGAVVDERFNSGGDIADYIIDNLQRPQFGSFLTREGAPWSEPTGSIYGPKAMIINAFAGSGGDAMPWMFRNAKVGPLVGTRTWGGLVGIGGYPVLMDGGTVTAPREAFYNMHGAWDVENHGVDPDIAAELEPAAWRAGHDLPLEAAVKAVMTELAAHPAVVAKVPAYPDYHQRFGAAATAVAPGGKAGGGGGH